MVFPHLAIKFHCLLILSNTTPSGVASFCREILLALSDGLRAWSSKVVLTGMYFFPLLITEDTLVHASVASMESQSGLKEEEGNTTTAANDTKVLTRQPQFQQLSPSEQEELRLQLEDDVRKMKYLFANLVTKTRDSIEERVPVGKFARSILALGAYEPAPGERDRALLDEHSEEIKRAGSISEIFYILSTYWSYLTYEILEDIIELYGTSDDRERLKKYDEELCNFCKRRTFELPPESGNDNMLSPKQKKFCVVLNFRKDITCEQLLQIRGRIAKILKVNLAMLTIQRGIDKLQTSEGQS